MLLVIQPMDEFTANLIGGILLVCLIFVVALALGSLLTRGRRR